MARCGNPCHHLDLSPRNPPPVQMPHHGANPYQRVGGGGGSIGHIAIAFGVVFPHSKAQITGGLSTPFFSVCVYIITVQTRTLTGGGGGR